jgi:DNA-binding GntR family transcriptional regulator
VSVAASLASFSYDAYGNPALAARPRAARSARAWLVVRPQRIVLAPGRAGKLRLSALVPRRAGDLVMLWAVLPGRGRISVRTRLGVVVLVRVPACGCGSRRLVVAATNRGNLAERLARADHDRAATRRPGLRGRFTAIVRLAGQPAWSAGPFTPPLRGSAKTLVLRLGAGTRPGVRGSHAVRTAPTLLESMLVSLERVQPPSLWEAVADRLRAAILRGELPAGTKLLETELAERFGTSRGPVREAIRELAREGLVLELPRRGTVVSTLTARDLAEVYAVREALDVAAARSAIATASDGDLQRLEGHLVALEAGGDYLEAAAHDLEFHRRIVALAGNRRMEAIYEQMLTQTLLLMRRAAEAAPTLKSSLRPSAHRDILAALLARDLERARAAIEEHYRYAEERLFGVFANDEPT